MPRIQGHQQARVVESLHRDVRPIAQEAADPLVVNPIRPACLERIGERNAQQKVAQLRGIENAGVEQGDKIRHAQ